jgi:hypothetical protein
MNPFGETAEMMALGEVMSHVDALAVLQRIEGLEETYPGFKEWYLHTVMPGLSDGRRRIFIDIEGQAVTGVAIAKREGSERKLCTLWRDAGGFGSASNLMRSAMDWLGTDRPSFTIPQDRIARLRPILNEFGMGAGIAVGELYRPGVREFLFNAREMFPGGPAE